MKRIVSIATVSGLVLGIAGAALAATPTFVGPTHNQVEKLKIVQALEQKEASDMQRPATPSYNEQESVIDNILNRLYRGDPVSEQEFENALRR